MKRRELLGSIGVAASAVVSGCSGLDSSSGQQGQQLEAHPASTGLGSQPVFGTPRKETDATIIAFEDPSCSRCAAFNTQVFPELKERHLDAGTATFVYRNVPIVYPWGEVAAPILESAYAESEEAFRTLKNDYYASQDKYRSGDVIEESRAVLEATPADAETVIENRDSDAVSAAVQTDLDAGDESGVTSTPTFFLFKQGKFVTRINGAEPLRVFENTLDLRSDG